MVDISRQKIYTAYRSSFKNRTRKLSVLSISIFTFLLFGFTTGINWHLETIALGLQYLDEVILNSITGVVLGGKVSLLLTAVYSVLTGIVITNFGVQLAMSNFQGEKLGSILPGFVATGCASCGIGLGGILGFTGAAALFPFQGDLFKLAGIMLLLYAMNEFGDPEICSINRG